VSSKYLKIFLRYQTLKVSQGSDGYLVKKAHWLTCTCIHCRLETLMAISDTPIKSTPDLQMPQASPLVLRIIGAVALAHLINDLIQAVLPSIYPMLKAKWI
jgi:FSR family fosmidomycin resistance protein-like MFS transporter